MGQSRTVAEINGDFRFYTYGRHEFCDTSVLFANKIASAQKLEMQLLIPPSFNVRPRIPTVVLQQKCDNATLIILISIIIILRRTVD